MFAVPIPESYHEAGETIEEHITQAIAESEQNGMASAGNDVTPWLLNRIRELSGGQSLESNIALLKNNALVGQCYSDALTTGKGVLTLWMCRFPNCRSIFPTAGIFGMCMRIKFYLTLQLNIQY